MRVVLVTKPGHADTGVGRYTAALEQALLANGHDVTVVHPSLPLPSSLLSKIKARFGWDLTAFFNNYPIWIRYPKADVYHITSQNMATLLLWRRPPGQTILTVHDIIPWLTRHQADLRVYRHKVEEWFDRLALWGICRADVVLTDSDYTQASLQGVLGTAVPPMQTVLLGVSKPEAMPI